MTKFRTLAIAFWVVTVLFCAEMLFTAYWEWLTPQAAQAFTRLGFSAGSFRVELSVAKILGVLVLLVPTLPARMKEWAYAGFAFNLVSALIAHASIHDQRAAFAPSTITLLLWVSSYLLWRRLSRVSEDDGPPGGGGRAPSTLLRARALDVASSQLSFSERR